MGSAFRWLRCHRGAPLGALLGIVVALVILSSIGGAPAHVASAGATATPSTQAPQSPGVPTVSAGCSINPLDWGSCISQAVNWAVGLPGAAAGAMWNLVVGVVISMYSDALGVIVSIFVSITNSFATLLSDTILVFASLASLMGIFALPFMTIALVGLASGLLLVFDLLKDTPILGAFT